MVHGAHTAPTAAAIRRPWWQLLYDEWLAAAFLAPAPAGSPAEEALDRTLDYIVDRLGLGAGDRVLDQCCGTGRLSVPLAARGYAVVGVDQASAYIAEARRAAARLGVHAELHAADAFRFVPTAPVAGVFNWWTSFGYADADDVNVRMLRCAHDALRPGGRLLLDTMNAASVLRGFEAESCQTVDGPHGPVELFRRSEVEWSSGTLIKRWEFRRADAPPVVRHSRVRLYHPHELFALLSAAGFSAITFDGDVDGSPLGLDSPRCIASGRRDR